MDLQIRKGTMDDVEAISNLYDALNDELEAHENYPGWHKGIYPAKEDAVRGVEDKELFVAMGGKDMVGTFILRHKPEEAYRNAPWKRDLTYDKVFVIYTFAVHPAYTGQGIGSQMLEFITQYAKKQGMQSIRLDVVDRNVPAICMYEKNCFEYIGTVDLGLESYGLKWFKLYEKLVR